MTRKFISVEEAFREWDKQPEFRAAYDALEDEFALAGALIKARGDSGLTQKQLARSMGTTQAVIARLESGRAMPSTRTLERFAKATGTRLRIGFEPAKAEAGNPRGSAADTASQAPVRRPKPRGELFPDAVSGGSSQPDQK